jgi:6,7-dimethyl-8-ribityllumazine synthase
MFKPISLLFFCVLTDNTMQQSIDRSSGIHGNKRTEAAIAAIKMAFIRQQASLTHQKGINIYQPALENRQRNALELKE